MRFYVRENQKEILINFTKVHPELTRGKFTMEFTRKKAQKLWEEAARILNSVEGGASKTWMQWRKTWQDLRKNAIAKQGRIRKSLTATGDGPPNIESINPTEQSILENLPGELISGQSEVLESLVKYHFDESDDEANLNNNRNDFSIPTSPLPSTSQSSNNILQENMRQTDHSYSVRNITATSTFKRKARPIKSRIARLNTAQQQSDRLLSLSATQMEETRNYRSKTIETMQDILKELKKINNNIEKLLENKNV